MKIYNTDPLKYDTDGDKVSDGDEIILGLDPNNPSTHGYPDNEYTTTQTVGEDSSALDYINNIEDNPYSVTVEIIAAGVAENNLSAGESGYSYSILQNDAVLGVVPELSYSDGLSVIDVVIKFKLDDSAVGNKLGVYDDEPEFNGIKRLQVFKYFEDNNILLPIETFYDEETKTVYTHVDELGTYCLMDMEMWINYLENLEPGNYYEEDDEVKSANIAFCLDTRYISDESSFDSVKSDMKAIAEDAFDRYADVKVYVYYQELGMSLRAKDNLLMDKDGNNYFTSYEEAEAAIDGMAMPKKSVAYDLVHASNYMIDLCDRSCKAEKLDKNIITMYHIANDDNIVGSVNDSKQLIRTVEESAYTDENDEQAYRINVSVICPNGTAKENSYVRKLVDASKGIFYSDSTSEVQVMTLNAAANNNEQAKKPKTSAGDAVDTNIVEILGKVHYPVINSVILQKVELDGILNKASKIDTDKDGIIDWDEVNVELIRKIKPSVSGADTIRYDDLPTLGQCLNEYSTYGSSYVENGLNQLMSSKPMSEALSSPILPIHSNPADADSDGDGFFDGITGKYKPTGYYKVADKWPLSSKPHPAFYQKDGEYYFNSFSFPETEVGGFTDGYDAHELNLTEEDQDYIYKLCVRANENTGAPKTDPLLVMSICAHETGCNELVNSRGYCGYTQFYYGYSDDYYKGQYYKNTIKKIIDTMSEDGYITSNELEILEQSSDEYRGQKEDIIKRKYIGITFGVALLCQNLSEREDLWEGLRHYCWTGDTHSAYEDYYYRNTLSKLIDEECIYEEKYKCVADYYIIINGINVEL